MLALLGLNDPWVLAAYLLCLLSTLICVIYGILRWNAGSEPVQSEDLHWAEEEKKVEQEL
jgi:hypothetical protein